VIAEEHRSRAADGDVEGGRFEGVDLRVGLHECRIAHAFLTRATAGVVEHA
jgi:hypothetical protein